MHIQKDEIMKKEFEINIVHLYPDLMNIYGDFGNISALKKRLEWRGKKTVITKVLKDDTIDFANADIIFIGGGQDKQQIAVAEIMLKQKEEFTNYAKNNGVMLAICGGYQLLGHYYQEQDGTKISGLGLIDMYTIADKKRSIGNVTVKTNFLTPNTLVGFENHNGQTYLQNETQPLGEVLTGYGNNKSSKTEGARYKNIFGTYLHGSLLPKNPAFCDYILELAIRNKTNDQSYLLEPLDDTFENLAHNNIINKPY